MIGNQKFGESSSRVVIEEFLDGEEFSYMSFVHDGQIYPMVIAQDHKRAYDGDKGPNTGGMGAYSPVPQISDSSRARKHMTKLSFRQLKRWRRKGLRLQGFCMRDLFLTEDGPKVIEFNARFGDPETQVVLPRMASDFGEFMMALMESKPFDLKWNDEAMLGVVVAADGYPEDVVKGKHCLDLDVFSAQGLDVFHAGTKLHGENFVGNGGRVILIAAKANSLKRSTEKCL